MNEVHKFVGNDGVEWVRIFDIPNAIIDSTLKINPYDKQKFVENTGKRKGKLKDIMELSAELSEKRAQKDGKDQVKERHFDNYEKTRCRGSVHPERKKEQLKAAIKKSKVFDVED